MTANDSTVAPGKAPRSSGVLWLYAVALLLALGMLGFGVYLTLHKLGYALTAAGGVSVIAVLVSFPLAKALLDPAQRRHAMDEALVAVHERLQQFSVMLNEISEQQLLSDRAKSVAYREKDREVLRRAIAEDIQNLDWEAALALADEMDTAFGYKAEAERIRGEINARFAEHIRRKIADASRVISTHTENQQWAAAFREAQRLEDQFPANEQVRNLRLGIEAGRKQHKQQLIEQYHDLVARKDVDGAIATLEKLDIYLTPEEAEGMQDSARGIFKDKLNSLKTQFTLAVQEHKWADAVRIGDTIVEDYPNVQMAREVSERMADLRARAAEARGEPVGAA